MVPIDAKNMNYLEKFRIGPSKQGPGRAGHRTEKLWPMI